MGHETYAFEREQEPEQGQEQDMGVFKDLKAASRGYSSNYLREGTYVARIDGCESFESRDEATFWKTTLTILGVDNAGDNPHRVGEQVHIMNKRRPKYPDMFLQAIKSFIAGVMDVADDEIGEAEAEEVLGANNPLAGMVTVVTARLQASRSSRDDNGDPLKFVVPSWSPALSDEEILEAIGEEGVERFFPSGL